MDKLGQAYSIAPTIDGLIEVELHPVMTKIENIDYTRAIDIGQTDALLIELSGSSNQGELSVMILALKRA